LERYRQGPSLLEAKIAGMSREILDYRPDRPDAWAIREHVIHFVDSDVNAFVRLKSIIAQPWTECYVMDEELWTRNLRRKREDPGKYLRLLRALREIMLEFLESEPEENWDRDYFVWNYGGVRTETTIAGFLERYIAHLDFHLKAIDELAGEQR
jgi:hypothetical protein